MDSDTSPAIEQMLRSAKINMWNTKLSSPGRRTQCEILPNEKNPVKALAIALEYFARHPECEVISVSMTEKAAHIFISWDNEDWWRVTQDGIWDLIVEGDRRAVAAEKALMLTCG